ncbi:hypothetical protein EC957_001782 [Mortierella hygrophila]|uniref:Uncharacterized protein n=1 Tax=Mortierella hygrophila TaxID=979708 RepID=A0A9P6F4E8_9FUNG|nr:hypothetical protein EC957_001782 [Mortierella hygrophila]
MKKFGKGSASKDKKKAPKEAPVPQTWEEYMEEGVLLEEKGERYATGDKARRFYEKAGDMYNKACQLNPEDSDCLYNFGRVLYILVDFSHDPCQKLALLNASIERFRNALIYDSENPDTLFNLGQALQTHADVIQDHDEDDEDDEHDHSHGDHDHDHGNPEERAAEELQEAISLFETCYTIQQHELYAAVQESREANAEDEKKPKDLAEQELQELSNSAGVLIDTLISASQALTSLAFLVDTRELSQEHYKDAAEKLDIALGIANDRALWPAPEDESASNGKGKGQQDDYAEPLESEEILPASKPVSTFREAESQSDAVSQKEKICEIHLQYSNLLSSQTDRNFQDTGKISEELYEKSLKHLNVVLRHHPRQVEALCDKGDLLGSWAQGLATFEQGSISLGGIEHWDSKSVLSLGTSDVVAGAADANEGKTDRASRIWQLFASATRAFMTALEVEPQNTSILEKLGDIHWSRSLLASPVALKNRSMLLNNASVYYRFAWESCKDGAAENVDEEQRLEILLSWAQVLRAIPGKEEEVLRVLKQWKRLGGSKEMLVEMLEGNSGDILQEDFVDFAVKQFTKGL